MTRESGADRLLRTLRRHGVDTAFGLCGDHVNPLFVAAARHGIRIVDVRHEAAAVHMADGYARVSGRIGVSIVTGGPGHTNSITGIATAAAAGSPVLALSGSYEPAERGRLAFQEMDQAATAQPLAKSARLAGDPARLEEEVSGALAETMRGRPGPVHLSIPLGVLSREVDSAGERAGQVDSSLERGAGASPPPAGASDASPLPPPADDARALRPDPAVVSDLLARLRAAQRPVAIAGSGALWSGAGADLTRFVEATGTPCFTIDLARGLLSDEHPLCFGYADPVLNPVARSFAEADFILIVGKRVDFRLGFGGPRVFRPEATLAQIDVRAEELGRNRPVQMPILADARETLRALAEEAQRQGPSGAGEDGGSRRRTGPEVAGPVPGAWPEKPWVGELRSRRNAWRESWREGEESDEAPLHPLRVCREARGIIDESTVLVFDGGDWPQWPRMTLQARRPGHWVRLGALGTVGAGLPLALGAQAARPGQRVVLFIGDGGMGFHLAELHTAVRHGLDVVVVVGDDEGWGMEREIQAALYGRQAVSGCELGPLRYDAIAAAMGLHSERVERPAHLRPALERAVASGAPALVDVRIRKGSVSPLTAASIAAKRGAS